MAKTGNELGMSEGTHPDLLRGGPLLWLGFVIPQVYPPHHSSELGSSKCTTIGLGSMGCRVGEVFGGTHPVLGWIGLEGQGVCGSESVSLHLRRQDELIE